ncbi:MAG: ATP synthase F1 subunit delta [Gemmatimonadota bacterium]
MSESAVARNYAATLFELAAREGGEEAWGERIVDVARLYADDGAVRRFLDAPSVAPTEKKEALRAALEGRVPSLFLRFLFVVLDRRRHRALPAIAAAYRDRLDERAGRLRASVALPFEPDASLREEIVGSLSRRFERDVVAEFRHEPGVIGGMIVRAGDRLIDGSVRRGLERLKWEMIR